MHRLIPHTRRRGVRQQPGSFLPTPTQPLALLITVQPRADAPLRCGRRLRARFLARPLNMGPPRIDTLAGVLSGSPGAPALVLTDGAGVTVSRGHLLAAVTDVATRLRGAGVRPGDVVSMAYANTVRGCGDGRARLARPRGPTLEDDVVGLCHARGEASPHQALAHAQRATSPPAAPRALKLNPSGRQAMHGRGLLTGTAHV
eukprot:364586-Chlamydomonas_euryale.AAC.26